MSIYDRDYMRGQGEKKSALSDFFGRISAVKALIIINVAIFIIGAFVDRFFGYGTFFRCSTCRCRDWLPAKYGRL